MQGDETISVLIGLAGACNNNPKTAGTDRVVLRALAADGEGDMQRDLLEEIRAEKYAVVPGCAMCASPCGNTSDYDMDRLYRADKEIRETKLQILSALRETAKLLLREPNADIAFVYKALLYVGNDVEVNALQEVLEEIQAVKQELRRYTEE